MEWIIDNDIAGYHRFVILENGQGGSVFAGNARIIELNVEFVTADFKIQGVFFIVSGQLNGIYRVPFRNVDISVKAPYRSDQPANQETYDTQMDHINTQPGPSSFFCPYIIPRIG